MSTMAERLLPMPEMLLDDICRFWSHVDVRSDSECWPWLSGRYRDAYGKFSHKFDTYCAHRIAYYIHYREDPGSLYVCHECANPICVNPHHLFAGTASDNNRQTVADGNHKQNGILNPSARLTEEDVREIRKLYGEFGYVRLGQMFQVSSSNIRMIVKGWTWRHVV